MTLAPTFFMMEVAADGLALPFASAAVRARVRENALASIWWRMMRARRS
jgi:hypothetical protein